MNNQDLINLSEKKNQIQDLLQDIFNEYNRMNETKIQNNSEKDLEMRTMIDNIRTLETSEKEKIDEIRNLKKVIHEYETLINNLNDKLEIAEEDKREENRFDMVRIQAKEISEKDREIERLNGLLNHYKKKDVKEEKQIDNVLTRIQSKNVTEITLTEVNEPVNEETGEVNPNFIYDDKDSDKSELSSESQPETQPQTQPESQPETQTESQDKGKLIIVTSKKIKYYAYENEDPQTVYEFNGNKIADKPLGTRMKNEKGKYKIQLFSS